MRVEQQIGFVLHRYPYRETSLLVELFTPEHGRLGAVAKGARRMASEWRGTLSPFQTLWLGWSGKGELATLTHAESAAVPSELAGAGLFCGLYLNELLMRLLPRDDAHAELFALYRVTLAALPDETAREAALRIFEKRLLQALGYGLVLDRAVNGDTIDADGAYRYFLERGAVVATAASGGIAIRGTSLLALHEERFATPESLGEAKNLLRQILAHYMGDKPLHARRLFQRRGASA